MAGRGRRYAENHRTMLVGMTALGFRPYLAPEVQSYIITTFHYPTDARFVFADFYQRLFDKGFIIYPGKLTKLDCFRIGNIGRLYPKDMLALVGAVEAVLKDMGVRGGRQKCPMTAWFLPGRVADSALFLPNFAETSRKQGLTGWQRIS